MGIDGALLATPEPVHRCFHIVVDAALRYATEGGKAPGMSVKQHLVGLQGTGHHQEGTAVGQLDMGHFQSASQSGNQRILAAPTGRSPPVRTAAG
jgi:hypothetical protein